MYKTVAALLMAALLTACSGGADFVIPAKAGNKALMDALSEIPLKAVASGTAVNITGEKDSELEITIDSAKSSQDSIFRIALAPNEDGRRTDISITIDVPSVSMGGNSYLSEDKVENYFREHITALVAALDAGESGEEQIGKLAEVLDAVTYVTNPEQVLARAASGTGAADFNWIGMDEAGDSGFSSEADTSPQDEALSDTASDAEIDGTSDDAADAAEDEEPADEQAGDAGAE